MSRWKPVDLSGNKFGKLTVLGRKDASFWECRCDCGGSALQRTYALTSGHANSCGCMQRKTHGLCGVRTYKSWDSMKQRCTNPNAPDYANYGGRGIVVCDRWLKSFDAFYADMGERPENTSLERIDNNKAYEPSNCKWASAKEQQRNKRNNPIVTYRGEAISVVSLAERVGLPSKVLIWRLNNCWDLDRAVSTPKFLRKG